MKHIKYENNGIEMALTKKAVKMLVAAGARFKVIDINGGEHGTLSVEKPKRKFRSNIFVNLGIPQIIRGLETVGAKAVVPCPEGITMKELRRACWGHANKIHGHKKIVTFSNGNTVEILRIDADQ